MHDLVRLFQEGGIWMYPLVMLAGLGLMAAPALGLGVLTRIRVPALAWWAAPAGLLALGALGTARGFSMGARALMWVAPEQKGPIAHAALSEGLVPLWTAASSAALMLLVGVGAAGLASLIGGDDAAGQARKAENRLAAGVSLLVGTGCAVGAVWLYAARQIHGSSLSAGPDHEAIWHALHLQGLAARGGLVALGLAALAAVALVVSAGEALLKGMTRLSLALAPLFVLEVMGVVALPWLAARPLVEGMIEPKLERLVGEVGDLPAPPPGVSALEGVAAPIWVWRDSIWQPLEAPRPAREDEPVEEVEPELRTLVASRTVPASALLQDSIASPGRLLKIVTYDPEHLDRAGLPWTITEALGVVSLGVVGGAAQDGARDEIAEQLASGAPHVLVRGGPDGVEISAPGEPASHHPDAASAAAAIRARGERDAPSTILLLAPGPSWKIADLVNLCLSGWQSAEEGRGAPRYSCAITAAEALESLPRGQEAPPAGLVGEGGSLGAGDPIILGSLDKSLIDQVIKRNQNQIRYCYQRELTRDPTLSGKVTVKFVIARDGSVSKAQTKSSTLGSPPVEDCINQRVMRMQFPEPKGGGIVIVSYPFLFQTE